MLCFANAASAKMLRIDRDDFRARAHRMPATHGVHRRKRKRAAVTMRRHVIIYRT
jgi:hypothetical protein